jgi:hypothetical protein
VEVARVLTEEFRRNEVLIDLPPDVHDRLEAHLDNWIKLWRFREIAHRAEAPHYIEAYQTVREAVLGHRLP